MNWMVYNLYCSEVCFDMIMVIKGPHQVKSKVAFFKSTKNAAEIGPFFLRCSRIVFNSRKGWQLFKNNKRTC